MYSFNVRHGRVIVKKHTTDGLHETGCIQVSFQQYTRRKGPGKAFDLILKELQDYPGSPWWIKKAIRHNAQLLRKHYPRVDVFPV